MRSTLVHLAAHRTTTTPPTAPGADTAEPADVLTVQDGRAVYTVAEVAHLLSLSLSSTYAMVRAGDIPARKIGARWVIPKRRFHTWLDELPEATDEDIEEDRRRYEHDNRPSDG